MISLRQGKAKNILENSINGAITAVDVYNKPNVGFRIENYIILMIVAWTKVFHAYFQSTIGERYFYKEKNGHYKVVDGERKAWELTECIKKYQKMNSHEPLKEAVVANLRFFIGIRNKIEHRYWDGQALDSILFGECQAMLYNYENFVINHFGKEYALNTCLAYALQFSHMRANEQMISQRELLSKDMEDIKRYIEKYRTDLTQEVFDSQEYSIKLLQIPKVSNTNRSDMSVEFVNWNALNEEDKENYRKLSAIIKDKLVIQPVSNANCLKPTGVVDYVNDKVKTEMKVHHHTMLWKCFKIRPDKGAKDFFSTNTKYCIFDEPHNDYLFTTEWVEFIAKLFIEQIITIDSIKEFCLSNKRVDDYE